MFLHDALHQQYECLDSVSRRYFIQCCLGLGLTSQIQVHKEAQHVECTKLEHEMFCIYFLLFRNMDNEFSICELSIPELQQHLMLYTWHSTIAFDCITCNIMLAKNSQSFSCFGCDSCLMLCVSSALCWQFYPALGQL